LACQDEFFVNSLLHVKEDDENALDFAIHLSCLFPYEFEDAIQTPMYSLWFGFFPEPMSNHCQDLLSHIFLELHKI
jgi:hypothetical protein